MRHIFALCIHGLAGRGLRRRVFDCLPRAEPRSQAVDPGWQIVYAGQPGYGGDGLMESMFGDGTGQPVVARAFQLPPINYQQQAPQAPVQPQAYQPAPADNQQTPALVPPARRCARPQSGGAYPTIARLSARSGRLPISTPAIGADVATGVGRTTSRRRAQQVAAPPCRWLARRAPVAARSQIHRGGTRAGNAWLSHRAFGLSDSARAAHGHLSACRTASATGGASVRAAGAAAAPRLRLPDAAAIRLSGPAARLRLSTAAGQ